MAQIKKSTQDYWNASFGEIGQDKTGVNALEIGALEQDGLSFERLPIGTSSGGTAVKVDLIGAETFSVSVGTITTLISGTVAKVTNLAAGTITKVEGGTVGLVSGVGTVGGSVGVSNLAAGTITKLEGGTIGNLASGSVVVTAGTVSDMDTVGTVGVVEAGSVVITAGTISDLDTVGTVGILTAGTVTNLASGSVVVTAGTISDMDTVGTVGRLEGGSVVVTAGTVTTILAGTQELLGTVANLAKGTITRLEGGTLGILTAGTVTALGAGTITTILAGTQQLLGTVNYLGTCGTLSNYPLISGEDQTNDVLKTEQQMSYSHYTIGSGTVKSAAGFLHAVTINTLATCPVTIYDAVGTAAATVASFAASAAPQTFTYNVLCPTGITIASTTAAVCDFTVSYR